MDILLTRVHEPENWQPLARQAEAFDRGETLRLGFVIADADADALGAVVPVDASAAPNSIVRTSPSREIFCGCFAPPPRLLLLGGGPDARPVATLAAFLGWQTTVVDHRASYLDAARFPPATRLIEARAAELGSKLQLDGHAAAIVMSHHLDSDRDYLRVLAHSQVPYVGLLGPASRREKLLADIGDVAAALRPRLRAPVGLDIGGRSPESIALSIVAEVHAALMGRGGRPFSEVAN
jgi:xanthine/CO dehydrogenase XdhC/CoxF family maturation factor